MPVLNKVNQIISCSKLKNSLSRFETFFQMFIFLLYLLIRDLFNSQFQEFETIQILKSPDNQIWTNI